MRWNDTADMHGQPQQQLENRETERNEIEQNGEKEGEKSK
jgi:hypothetical protein